MPGWTVWLIVRRVSISLVLVCAVSAWCAEAPPVSSGELFVQDKVWAAELKVASADWEAMEPGVGNGWGAMFAAGRRPVDVGGALAAAMLKWGDGDKNGVLEVAEFRDLAGRWFDRWDGAGAGALDVGQVAAGLNAVLDPEGTMRGTALPFSLRAPEGKRNGLATAFGWEFKEVKAAMTFAGEEFKEVGLRYKGNGTFKDSQKSLKRSLKVDVRQFDKGAELAGVAKLNFHNNVTDPSGMMESVAYRLYREAGVPSPRTTYARVTVTVPGKHDRAYFGLYSVVENVDGRFARDRFGTDGGAIFKPTTCAPFADLGDDWTDYRQTYDPKTEVTAAQARRVIELARLVTYADEARFAAKVGEFLDLDEFARYLAVTTYLSALDSIYLTGQNYFLYLDERAERFRIIPWDLDHAFGGVFGEEAELVRLSVRRPWVGTNRFLERLFKVEAFERAYLARMEEFARTIFSPERFHAQVDALTAAIRPAVEAESKQMLVGFDRSVAEPPAPTTRPVFSFFPSRPVRSIKRFVDARTPNVLDQLAGKAKGEPAKGFGGGWGGGRNAVDPGQVLGPRVVAGMKGEDGRVTREAFVAGFARWFAAWDLDRSGGLSREKVVAGVGKDLAPPAQLGRAGAGATTTMTTRPSATRPGTDR